MKSRLVIPFLRNDNPICFTLDEYQNLKTDQDKKSYLLNSLQYFLSTFDKNSISRQKIQPQLYQSFKEFAESFSTSFSLLIADEFDLILKIIPVEYQILETIPNSSNFIPIVDIIFSNFYTENISSIDPLSKNLIITLFSIKSFCQDFINSEKYSEVILNLISFSNPTIIEYIESLFLGDIFIECIISKDLIDNSDSKNQTEIINCSKYILHFSSKLSMYKIIDESKIYKMYQFESQLISQIYAKLQTTSISLANSFIETISQKGLFDKANSFFIAYPSPNFMSMFYEDLLNNINDDQKGYNPIIFDSLKKLYQNENFVDEDGRVTVIYFFFKYDKSFYLTFFTNPEKFHIFDWLDQSVLHSSIFFKSISAFLMHCVDYNFDFLSNFVYVLIDWISPPSKNDIVYNDVFDFFMNLFILLDDYDRDLSGIAEKVNSTNQNRCFDLPLFLKKVFYDPSIDDVLFYFNNYRSFRQLIYEITSRGRESYKKPSKPKIIKYTNSSGQLTTNEIQYHINLHNGLFDEAFFDRILSLMNFESNKASLQDYFLSILKNLFGKSLLLYFFSKIELSEIQIIVSYLAYELTNQFIHAIMAYDLLDCILNDILTEENGPTILNMINILATKTNNHFFDEFVISRMDSNSTIFKLKGDLIKSSVLPASNRPIPIPSLIPLLHLENSDFKHPYNIYLLGCYSLPIFRLLNMPIPSILHLNEIFHQFIRFDDIFYIFEKDIKNASILINTKSPPPFPFNLYEVFPTEIPTYFSISSNSNFIGFQIRFESISNSSMPLFVSNDVPIVFIKDGCLLDSAQNAIQYVSLLEWHTFSFYFNKSQSTVSIFINSKLIKTFQSNSFKINTIGASNQSVPIHYLLKQSIAIGSNQTQFEFLDKNVNKYMKANGNALFVPYQSFYSLFNSKLSYTKLFDFLEKTEPIPNLINSDMSNLKINLNNEINLNSQNDSNTQQDLTAIKSKYHEKASFLICLICNLFEFKDVSSKWLINRYKYGLYKHIELCEPFYLTSILYTIISRKDKLARTKLFTTFFCDFFFWSRIPEKIISQCLDFLNGYITDISKVFDVAYLDKNNMIKFVLHLIYFYQNSFLLNGLIYFLKLICMSLDEKNVIINLSNFSIISRSLTSKSQFIFFQNEINLLESTIIRLCLEIEQNRKIKIFNTDQQLIFALLLKKDLAFPFAMRALQMCNDNSDQFIQQKVSLLCRIASRFSSNIQMWQKLFHLLTNNTISLNQSLQIAKNQISNGKDETSNGNFRASILPIFFSALIPLFNNESRFAFTIKSKVIELFCSNPNNQLVLISKTPNLSVFYNFLKGSVFGYGSLTNSAIQNEYYPTFINKLAKYLNLRSSLNNSFFEFNSTLIASMLICHSNNYKRFSQILNLAANLTTVFLIETLIKLFSDMSDTDFSTQELTLLNDASLYSLFNELNIEKRDELSNSLFQYCCKKKDKIGCFINFFVFGYHFVSVDVQLLHFILFEKYFDMQQPKALSSYIPFLYIILCTDLTKLVESNQTKDKHPNKTRSYSNLNRNPLNSNQSTTITSSNQNRNQQNANTSANNVNLTNSSSQMHLSQSIDQINQSNISHDRSAIKKVLRQNSKNKLLNIKSEKPKTIIPANDKIFEKIPFIRQLHQIFISNFKSNPKDNILSLLLKYDDISEWILRKPKSPASQKDLIQLQEFLEMKMGYLNVDIFNRFKVKNENKVLTPLNDSLGTFLFQYQLDIIRKSQSFLKLILTDMNTFLRYFEKSYSSSIFLNSLIKSQKMTMDELNTETKSYHISPFYLPGIVPNVMIPSPFSLLNKAKEKNTLNIHLFGFENRDDFHSFANSEINPSIFTRYSGYFDTKNGLDLSEVFSNNDNFMNVLNVTELPISHQMHILTFIGIYGLPQHIYNCNLVRLLVNISCVLFKYNDHYLLLTNCQFDGKELFLQNINQTLLELIYLNEFGKYSLYCGHPIIKIKNKNVILAYKSTDDTITYSICISSYKNGSFLLSFQRENIEMLQQVFQSQNSHQFQEESPSNPPSIPLTSFCLAQREQMEKWLQGKISNLDYLIWLNIFSGRSFDDISSYPIVPRVLTSFESGSFIGSMNSHLRNFELPIPALAQAFSPLPKSNPISLIENNEEEDEEEQIFHSDSNFNCDLSDPCFDTLKLRFESTKCHNTENISNGSVVSSFLIRIPPFFNYSLQFNDGSFDTANRIFSSIGISCSISKFSTSELTPELFTLPEMLRNDLNKIEFPSGVSENVLLPKWCYMKSESNGYISSFNFIQFHRRVLECKMVRTELSKWIDLIFGFKQLGEDAINSFNVYNILSYQSSMTQTPSFLFLKTQTGVQNEMRKMRSEFVKNSGQMPLKIFKEPHPPYVPIKKPDKNFVNTGFVAGNLFIYSFLTKATENTPQNSLGNLLYEFSASDVVVNCRETKYGYVHLDSEKGTITIDTTKNVFTVFDLEFQNAVNVTMSNRRLFFAVTLRSSMVKIYRLSIIINEKNSLINQFNNTPEIEKTAILNHQITFERASIKFSVVNDRQFICATCCTNEVILWSIVNGFIIKIIPMKNVHCIAFDPELDIMYIGENNLVHQYSINGIYIRSIDTQSNDSVESIAIGGFGFSYDSRFIAVGKRSGHVLIYKQDNKTMKFELVSEFEVSNYPITALIAKQNVFDVEAIDSFTDLFNVI